jgi:hypothetical protein
LKFGNLWRLMLLLGNLPFVTQPLNLTLAAASIEVIATVAFFSLSPGNARFLTDSSKNS